MSLIRNEQTKLTATWLNAISAASIAVGGIAQLAPLFNGTNTIASDALVGLFSGAWCLIGIVLHLAARWTSRNLVE